MPRATLASHEHEDDSGHESPDLLEGSSIGSDRSGHHRSSGTTLSRDAADFEEWRTRLNATKHSPAPVSSAELEHSDTDSPKHLNVTPSASFSASPGVVSLSRTSPLLEKLRHIADMSESVDEEEDKRHFFARLEAQSTSDSLPVWRQSQLDRVDERADGSHSSNESGANGFDKYLASQQSSPGTASSADSAAAADDRILPCSVRSTLELRRKFTSQQPDDEEAPSQPRAVLAYDTTGDGQLDAFDTNQDGLLDTRTAGSTVSNASGAGASTSTTDASAMGAAAAAASPSPLPEPEKRLSAEAGLATQVSPPRRANADQLLGVWEKSPEGWRQLDSPSGSPAHSKPHTAAAVAPSPGPKGSEHEKAMFKSRLPIRTPPPTPPRSRSAKSTPARGLAARSPGGPTLTAPLSAGRRARSGERVRASSDLLQQELTLLRLEVDSAKDRAKSEVHAREQCESRLAAVLHGRATGPNAEAGTTELFKERVVGGGSLDGVTPVELRGVERMIREQERLLTAYQRDNELKAAELKAAKAKVAELTKALEAPLANGAALSSAPEQRLRQAANPVRGSAAASPARMGDRAALEAADDPVTVAALRQRLDETRQLGRQREIELKHELDWARVAKKETEARFAGLDIPSLQSESAQLGALQRRQDELEAEHKAELAAVRKQMEWYVENQEMVDKNDAELAAQRATISGLERKLDAEVDEQAGAGGGGKGGKAGSGGAAAARKIKELEKQVGTLRAELEDVLKRKHPNSIPALIRAARQPVEETAAHAYLQKRAETLEATLHEREEEHAKSLRALRQGFERIRSQNEKRLAELTAELKAKDRQLTADQKPHLRVKELERQLEDTRSYYTKRLRALSTKLTDAPKGGGGAGGVGPTAAQQANGKANSARLKAKLRRLEATLSQKDAELEELREAEGPPPPPPQQQGTAAAGPPGTPPGREAYSHELYSGAAAGFETHEAALRDNWMMGGAAGSGPPHSPPGDRPGSPQLALGPPPEVSSLQTDLMLLKIKSEAEVNTARSARQTPTHRPLGSSPVWAC